MAPAFVEKDVLAGVAERLPRLPLPARRGDIRASLFVGLYGFFEGEAQAPDGPPQRAEAGRRGQRAASLGERGIGPRRDGAG